MDTFKRIQAKKADLITTLDEKFQNRSVEYQKDIDTIITKIDFKNNSNLCKFIIGNTTVDCFLMNLSDEITEIIKSAEFVEIEMLYFLYKIMGIIEEDVYIVFNVYQGKTMYELFKKKNYFNQIIKFQQNFKTSNAQKIDKLDEIAEDIDLIQELKIHGNSQSISANLLDIPKYLPFRVSPENELTFKIKAIKNNEVKNIICPVCKATKKLYLSNKNNLFQVNGDKIRFLCNHIGCEFFDKKPVSIDIKHYKKELVGINKLDWVIYNYHYFFKKYEQKELADSKEELHDWVI